MCKWRMVSLDNVGRIVTGSTPPSAVTGLWGNEVPFITPSEMEFGSRRPSVGRKLSEAGRRYLASRLLPDHAVCVTCIASIGKMCMTTEPSVTNQQVNSIIVDSTHFDPAFVFYAVRHALPKIQSYAGGSVAAIINKSTFAGMEIRFPALAEQRAIAEVLGALDDKIENCYRVANLADSLFLAEWHRRFSPIQDAPTGRLADYCSTQYGYTASATDNPKGPKFLRVMDINKTNWINWSRVPHCAPEATLLHRYGLKPGDIVVARMADPGQAALVEEHVDAVFASYLVRLVPARAGTSRFFYGFLKSKHYRDHVASHSAGSVQKNMNAKIIVDVDLAVPPHEALIAFDTWAEPVRGRVVAALKEAATAGRARDTLLPKLLSGELRVRDAANLVEEAI